MSSEHGGGAAAAAAAAAGKKRLAHQQRRTIHDNHPSAYPAPRGEDPPSGAPAILRHFKHHSDEIWSQMQTKSTFLFILRHHSHIHLHIFAIRLVATINLHVVKKDFPCGGLQRRSSKNSTAVGDWTPANGPKSPIMLYISRNSFFPHSCYTTIIHHRSYLRTFQLFFLDIFELESQLFFCIANCSKTATGPNFHRWTSLRSEIPSTPHDFTQVWDMKLL